MAFDGETAPRKEALDVQDRRAGLVNIVVLEANLPGVLAGSLL